MAPEPKEFKDKVFYGAHYQGCLVMSLDRWLICIMSVLVCPHEVRLFLTSWKIEEAPLLSPSIGDYSDYNLLKSSGGGVVV